MTNNRQIYFSPSVEMNEMAAERGFVGSMFEDPIEKPEQGW